MLNPINIHSDDFLNILDLYYEKENFTHNVELFNSLYEMIINTEDLFKIKNSLKSQIYSYDLDLNFMVSLICLYFIYEYS